MRPRKLRNSNAATLLFASTVLLNASLSEAHEDTHTHHSLSQSALALLEAAIPETFFDQTAQDLIALGSVQEDSIPQVVDDNSIAPFCFHFFNPHTGRNDLLDVHWALGRFCGNLSSPPSAADIATDR